MRATLLFAVLAIPVLAQAPADGGAFKVGDRIDIHYDGRWYSGKVLEFGQRGWLVEYDSDPDWDSWMPADRLRVHVDGPDVVGPKKPVVAPDPVKPKDPGAEPVPVRPRDPGAEPAPVTGDPVVGEQCEASWNNSWYWVRILKTDGDKYFIHWDGYGDAKDEWVTRDQLRRKGEAKDNNPRKGREGNGGGLAPAEMVGKDAEAYWRGRWYPVTVLKTDGKLLRVKYITNLKEGVQEEWVVKERVRDAGAEARYTIDPAKVPGKKGLEGLWYRIQYVVDFDPSKVRDPKEPVGKGNAAKTVLNFFYGDGRAIRHTVPVDRDDKAFAALQGSKPKNCGGYGIEGPLLNLRWGGDSDEDPPVVLEVINANEMKFNGVPLFRAREFKKGARLSGEYLSQQTITGSQRWIFRDDGTFEFHQVRSVGTEVKATDATGTYELAGYELIISMDGKAPQRYVAFPFWEEGKPQTSFFMGDFVLSQRM